MEIRSSSVVYLAADHRGFVLKEALKKYLSGEGFSVVDCGAHELKLDDDYPDFAQALAWKVAGDSGSRGIAICGSGIGMAIAANKIRGVRAAVSRVASDVRVARNDEDINVLCLGSDHMDADQAEKIVGAFLSVPASREERHMRRRMKLE